MPKNAERDVIDNRLGHYRLVSVLAALEAECPKERLDVSNGGNRINIASVAKAMHVPVAIATYPDGNGMQTYDAYGFSSATGVGPLAAAYSRLCSDRALVVSDIAAHSTLSAFVGLLPKSDIRFLVGISLQNNRGQRVGSLAVMNTSKAVASRGVSFKTLLALGKAFAETGRLHAELIATEPTARLRI